MLDQMRCPNCGGQKLKSEKKEIAQKVKLTGKERNLLSSGGWFFLIVGGALVLVGVPLKNNYSFVGWIGILFATIGLIILLIRTSKGLKKVVGYNYAYTCLTCGHKWKWKKGSPLPKVKANPVLRK